LLDRGRPADSLAAPLPTKRDRSEALSRLEKGRLAQRNQEHLPGSLARLEHPVGFRGLLKRHFAEDRELHDPVANPAEDLARALEKLLAKRDVMKEGRPRQIDRALLVQGLRIDRGDGAARLAEEDHHAAPNEAIEPL